MATPQNLFGSQYILRLGDLHVVARSVDDLDAASGGFKCRRIVSNCLLLGHDALIGVHNQGVLKHLGRLRPPDCLPVKRADDKFFLVKLLYRSYVEIVHVSIYLEAQL